MSGAPAAVVVLDPGHGGEADVGGSTANRAVGPDGALEKHLVLDIARRVEVNLNGWGGRTHLTRRTDRNRPLAERAALAREVAADAFVSLHLGQRDAQGTLTAIHTGASPRSRRLAEHIHGALLRVTGHPDLGVQALPLTVLEPHRHADATAAVLVESSVLSDTAEAKRLSGPAYRGAIAGAIGSAVRRWVQAEAEAAQHPTAARHAGRAVVLGVDAYPEAPLRFARSDAVALAGILTRACGFDATRVQVLDSGTADAVRTALERAARQLDPGAPLCLAFAGRGTCDANSVPMLVTADGVRVGPSELAGLVPEDHVLTVLADAGHAVAPSPGGRSLIRDATRPAPWPDGDPDRVRWIGAATPGGEAHEHAGAGHGIFTAALQARTRGLQALDISHRGLTTRLQEDVAELLLRCGVIGRQRPHCSLHARDTRVLTSPPAPAPPPLRPVRHHVPLVPQSSEMSCWAAAAAMVVGWRERISLDDDELARLAGQLEAYRLGLLPEDVDTMAEHWSLSSEAPRSYTVAELHAVLQDNGPLWIGEADPDLHVVVVNGMRGDGTPDGTEVEIADPWPIGRGERYTITFRELMENLATARDIAGPHVQVMHTGGREAPDPGTAVTRRAPPPLREA